MAILHHFWFVANPPRMVGLPLRPPAGGKEEVGPPGDPVREAVGGSCTEK